jgi:hypothetical protein
VRKSAHASDSARSASRKPFKKRLAEAIQNDETLPLVLNGRNQLFPKIAFEAWYAAAAASRQNVHAA